MKDHFIRPLMAVFAAVFLAGIATDVHRVDTLSLVGAVGLLALLGEWRLRRMPRSVEAAYQLGCTDGHRQGYDEGRRTRLSPVVPIYPPVAESGGTWPATDRRLPGSPLRGIPDDVESTACQTGAGSDLPR